MKHSKNEQPTILLVDDETGIRYGIKSWLEPEFRVYDCGDYHEALDIMKTQSVDVAILDIRLKGKLTGIDLFHEIKLINPNTSIIFMTGFGDVESAVTLVKEGAHDYLSKPIDNNKLQNSINTTIEIRKLREENQGLRTVLSQKHIPGEFITLNPQMKAIREKADKVKSNSVPILITGESGTGKEIMARYIHYTSDRKLNNFVAFNCAAISDSLILNELFGHEKGAYTGADSKKIGKFEEANHGTLFMDEIGDMSLKNQAALLRVLESQSFERVGGNKSIHVDVRVIAATNKNLKQMVIDNQYREDLYYRINVVNLELPPLRQRAEEIPALVNYFIKNCNRKYKKNIESLDEEAMALLMNYNWPGNIRELNSVVNQMVLFNDKKVLQKEDIDYAPIRSDSSFSMDLDYDDVPAVKKSISEFTKKHEKNLIEHILEKENYNQSRAAEILEMTRKTLSRKIQFYQISLPK